MIIDVQYLTSFKDSANSTFSLVHRSIFFVGCTISRPNRLLQRSTTMSLINKILEFSTEKTPPNLNIILCFWAYGDKKRGVIIFPEAKKEVILRITYQFLWETLVYPLTQWDDIRFEDVMSF